MEEQRDGGIDVAEWQDIEASLAKKKGQLCVKRALDVALSLAGIVVLSPVLICCAAAIKLDSPGPVFYRQVRVGRGGKTFRIYKLRTMKDGADRRGPEITVGGDARITRVGRVLRKYKLDELAQLFNVLLGDMSFVGPRPEVPRYVKLYSDAQRKVLLVRPGITDTASIAYRNENDLLATSADPERTYVEEVMPAKLELGRQYIEQFSLWGDLRLIWETVFAVAKGE